MTRTRRRRRRRRQRKAAPRPRKTDFTVWSPKGTRKACIIKRPLMICAWKARRRA